MIKAKRRIVTVVFNYFRRISERLHHHECVQKVTARGSIFFYRTANVENIKSDSAKIVLGNNCHIRGELLIFNYGGEISIGNNFFLGEGSRIWSGEKIIIGNDVLISHNVNVMDTNSHEMNHRERADGFLNIIEKGHPRLKNSIVTGAVTIHDHAWISFNSTILKGITIGRGAVVAACSVVTKDVPDFAVVAGNPARIINYTS